MADAMACPACSTGHQLDAMRDHIKGRPAPPPERCGWCSGTQRVDYQTAARHGREMDAIYLRRFR